MAFEKLLEEFSQAFFDGGFNTLVIYLRADIHQLHFSQQPAIGQLQMQLRKDFANNFTRGDMAQAKKRLTLNSGQMRPKDKVIIASLKGGIFTLLGVAIFITLLEPDLFILNRWAEAKSVNTFSRFLFAIAFLLHLSGHNIKVFRRHEINYMHIFELSYDYRVQDDQLFKIAYFFYFFWAVFTVLSYIEGNVDAIEQKASDPEHAKWFDQFFAIGFLGIII